MTATDEMRRMLDERGVEYQAYELNPFEKTTAWDIDTSDSAHEVCAGFEEFDSGTTLLRFWNCTPKQAVEATLGSCNCSNDCTNGERTETLTAEQVMTIAGKHQPDYCSDTHVCFDWQAIADELNATLGAGTCRNESEYPQMFFYCSECGCAHKRNRAYVDMPRFCPKCGRRIEVDDG